MQYPDTIQKVLVTKTHRDSAAGRHSAPSLQAKKLSPRIAKCLFYRTALLWIYSFSEKTLIWRQRQEQQQVTIHQFSGNSEAFMRVVMNRPFAQLSTIYAVHVKGLHLTICANKSGLLKYRDTWISIVTKPSKIDIDAFSLNSVHEHYKQARFPVSFSKLQLESKK